MLSVRRIRNAMWPTSHRFFGLHGGVHRSFFWGLDPFGQSRETVAITYCFGLFETLDVF